MQPPSQPPPFTEPVQLSPHLHVVLSEFPHRGSANAYLITGQHPTLIDCGSMDGFPTLAHNLAQLRIDVAEIAQVVATHGHFDHVQGMHGLHRHKPQLPLLIHERDRPTVLGDDPYQTAAVVYDRPFKPIPADGCIPLVDGQEIPAGDGSLTVHHTPGHTDGSICLSGTIDGVAVLFTGDTVFGAMSGVLGADIAIWTAAIETWRRSLHHIAALPFDVFLTGHDPAQDLPFAKGRLTRAIPYFGRMLSPWFSLDEDDEVVALESYLAPKPATASTLSGI